MIEFFWYGCPHCFAFEPEASAWAKKLSKDFRTDGVPALGVASRAWTSPASASTGMRISEAESRKRALQVVTT